MIHIDIPDYIEYIFMYFHLLHKWLLNNHTLYTVLHTHTHTHTHTQTLAHVCGLRGIMGEEKQDMKHNEDNWSN